MTYRFIFGVFNKGRLVFSIGNPVVCSINQAEFIALLLEPAISKVLENGDYFAYDFV